jgi:hypothetical protein
MLCVIRPSSSLSESVADGVSGCVNENSRCCCCEAKAFEANEGRDFLDCGKGEGEAERDGARCRG